MKKLFLAAALIVLTVQGAQAQQLKPVVQPQPQTPPPKPVIAEKHKRWKALYRAPIFVVQHPVQTFNRLTFPIQHPLQTGQWMEKSGFNGLLAGLGALGNLGTTSVVSAKKF